MTTFVDYAFGEERLRLNLFSHKLVNTRKDPRIYIIDSKWPLSYQHHFSVKYQYGERHASASREGIATAISYNNV